MIYITFTMYKYPVHWIYYYSCKFCMKFNSVNFVKVLSGRLGSAVNLIMVSRS